MRTHAALAAILAFSLAACGQSGGNGQAAGNMAASNYREGYRTVNLAACQNMFQSAEAGRGGNAQTADFSAVCTCYVDRAMTGLSDAQLRQMQVGPREQDILHQCAREQGMMPTGPAATQ